MIAQKKPRVMPGRRKFLKAAVSGAGVAALLPRVVTPAVQAGYPNLAHLRAQHENAGIISPQKTYRMMEWEAHTPPEEHFNINLEDATRAAKDADAESMMFYSQDHWGYAYYSSDVAVRHPHLDRDIFGTEVSLAHKLDLSVVCYYSLQFNNQIVLSHPDWGWVDEKGEQHRNRWYVTCLDSPYRQYVLGMMNEIFSRYEVAELFLDIYGIQFSGYHSRGVNLYDKSGEHILVQVLNTVEAAMEGEYRGIPKVRIGVDGRRLKVTRARMVWPKEEELEVHHRGARTEVVLQNPPHYTALS